MSRIIVGLEIGTSCIRCVIGQIGEDEHLQIIGAAKRPSNKGLQKGVIVNISAAMTAIKTEIVIIFRIVFFLFFVLIIILSFRKLEKSSKGSRRPQADGKDR